MLDDVDWSRRAEHMSAKHGVTVAHATEALTDPERVVIDPDYNSKSGVSIRVIGYSRSFGDLLALILVPQAGTVFEATGFRAKSKDRRIYNQEVVSS